MKSNFPPAIWAWTILILVASFLNWGTIRVTQISGFPSGFPGGLPGNFPGELFGGMTLSVNGWNGHLTLGAQLPNWLAVVAALCATLTVYLQSTGAQLSPRLAPFLLLYSFCHVAILSLILLFGGQGTLGIGAIAMLIGVGGLFKTMLASRPNVMRQPNL